MNKTNNQILKIRDILEEAELRIHYDAIGRMHLGKTEKREGLAYIVTGLMMLMIISFGEIAGFLERIRVGGFYINIGLIGILLLLIMGEIKYHRGRKDEKEAIADYIAEEL